MEIKHINQKEFETLVSNPSTDQWLHKGNRPALVDFYATWCGPCQALSPILEETAKEYEGKIDIYKVDVDQEPELTTLFNIRTVPTLLFSREGMDQPELMLGVMGKAELRQHIEKILLG